MQAFSHRQSIHEAATMNKLPLVGVSGLSDADYEACVLEIPSMAKFNDQLDSLYEGFLERRQLLVPSGEQSSEIEQVDPVATETSKNDTLLDIDSLVIDIWQLFLFGAAVSRKQYSCHNTAAKAVLSREFRELIKEYMVNHNLCDRPIDEQVVHFYNSVEFKSFVVETIEHGASVSTEGYTMEDVSMPQISLENYSKWYKAFEEYFENARKEKAKAEQE